LASLRSPLNRILGFSGFLTLAAANCYVIGDPFVALLGGTALFKEDDKEAHLLDLKGNTYERNLLKKCLDVHIEQAVILPRTSTIVGRIDRVLSLLNIRMGIIHKDDEDSCQRCRRIGRYENSNCYAM
jgi:hypothetical protein